VFVDVFGGVHAVQLPADRFDLAVQRGAPFDGSALEGRARHLEADMLLRPDPATLLQLGDGRARAACTMAPPGRAIRAPPWPASWTVSAGSLRGTGLRPSWSSTCCATVSPSIAVATSPTSKARAWA
jgi:hypothetical protein